MVREGDVREVVKMLGDLAVREGTHAEKKRLLLSRVCGLIDGDEWSWSLQRAGETFQIDGMTGPPLSLVAPHLKALAQSRTAMPGGHRPALSVVQVSGDVVSTIRMARGPGRKPFSGREQTLAQIVLSEIPWLHEREAIRVVERPQLPPRQRETLRYLADGLSRGEIAERLRLSPHTVHGYIKNIYRFYGVNSRGELMRCLTTATQGRLT